MTDITIRHDENHRSLTTSRILRRLVKRAYDRWVFARAETSLRCLGDRELDDIGLERCDIAGAVRGARSR